MSDEVGKLGKGQILEGFIGFGMEDGKSCVDSPKLLDWTGKENF